MPKFLLKISSALISLSLIAIITYPVLAQDATKPGVIRKQIIQEKTEVKKGNVENKIDLLKEKQASKTAAFKVKLETFKDKLKASAAARINTNLNMINQKQTSQMQKHLNTMTSILDRLEKRVNLGSPEIKNPASASAAIASARASIASASAAVTAQSQNDYTIQVTSESKVKTDAKLQRDKLHTDLLAVRKLVIDAKQSVGNAIRTAKSEKEATSSGQQ